jgi:hypothetical protein
MGHAPRTLLLVLLVVGLQRRRRSASMATGKRRSRSRFRPITASRPSSSDDDEIDLTVGKGAQHAVYSARGEVSAEGIAVKFGSFGEFVADYQPFRTLETREPGRRCEGEPQTTTEGFFRGTLRFRGERDYVRIEAARVKGTLVLHPRWSCDYGSARASRARGRKEDEDEATLGALSRRRLPVRQPPRDRSRRPAAPFAGSARYVRRPDARDGWNRLPHRAAAGTRPRPPRRPGLRRPDGAAAEYLALRLEQEV